jgi:hypothetical protein
MEVLNIPELEKYEAECNDRALEMLENGIVKAAINMLLFDYDMNPDEIRAAAIIVDLIESGETD